MSIRILDKADVADLDWVTDRHPRGDKVLCLSLYGVLRIGKFDEALDVAWMPLPRPTPVVKEIIRFRISNR